MLFLYLGAFPPYINLSFVSLYPRLSAEGFLEPFEKYSSEDSLIQCVVKLNIWYHLVLCEPNSRSWFEKDEFRVLSCWQHLCRKEASKIKFLHVLQSCDDVLIDQRRLCAHCNTLFAFKEVCDSIKSDCSSTTRSLLCFGPGQHYPIPIHAMDFKLLRVLDAAPVRFYYFPLEILKLVCLKYLALIYSKELPVSISNLFHLRFLIIHPHELIKKRGASSDMPVDIWDMQELQHIEVLGSDLPIPNSDATLYKLSTLFGVSAKSCTKEILKRVPNLKSLAILKVLKPYDDDDINEFSGLDCISEELQNLTTLIYSVVKPDMKYEFVVPLSMFPSSLLSLNLYGLGCPWRYMNHIGSLLPNLNSLKLADYAFRGSEWEIESECFLKLETIVIEDTDLVRWKAQLGSLPRLDLLSIRHCYKLQQLDWARDPSMAKTTIELVECNPIVVASANQLPESLFTVRCHSTI